MTRRNPDVSNILAMTIDFLRTCSDDDLAAVAEVVGPRLATLEWLDDAAARSLIGEDAFTRGIQSGQLRGRWLSGQSSPAYRRTDLLRIL